MPAGRIITLALRSSVRPKHPLVGTQNTGSLARSSLGATQTYSSRTICAPTDKVHCGTCVQKYIYRHIRIPLNSWREQLAKLGSISAALLSCSSSLLPSLLSAERVCVCALLFADIYSLIARLKSDVDNSSWIRAWLLILQQMGASCRLS